MTIDKRIDSLKPIPERFTKIDGTTVEDVLKILEEKGITKYLCYYSTDRDFRRHTIIINAWDYDTLYKNGLFGELDSRGNALSCVGFWFDAKYKLDDFSRLESGEVEVPYPIEMTQIRRIIIGFSREDSLYCEVNNISTTEAHRRHSDGL
ncbi:MAG: hypothetical protein ABIG89_03665 [Candidatus Woesearchaeota archaeon]